MNPATRRVSHSQCHRNRFATLLNAALARLGKKISTATRFAYLNLLPQWPVFQEPTPAIHLAIHLHLLNLNA
jgi:hypothetical protein